jgi:hypothetical protein
MIVMRRKDEWAGEFCSYMGKDIIAEDEIPTLPLSMCINEVSPD